MQSKPSAKEVAKARRDFKAADAEIEAAAIYTKRLDAAVGEWWRARNVLDAAGAIEPVHELVRRLEHSSA